MNVFVIQTDANRHTYIPVIYIYIFSVIGHEKQANLKGMKKKKLKGYRTGGSTPQQKKNVPRKKKKCDCVQIFLRVFRIMLDYSCE